jgi:two-component system sensor histidine kinase SenX3
VLTESALATARAFGGFALVVTPSHLVVYASDAAATLPVATDGRLTHPALVALADEVWRSPDPVARVEAFADLGPIEEAELRGSRVDERFILLVISDRTEQVRTEAIRRDFVANIGHELRTPIAAVSLIAETLLAASDSPDTVRHFSARLQEEGERMARLTEDVMSLAAVQDKTQVVTLRPVAVRDIVAGALAGQAMAAAGQGIEVTLGSEVDAEVLGDAQALTSAVENLLANAINYSAPGSRVSVATSVDSAADEVHIAVIDTGIGIPAHELDRIFERFYRVDAARSRRSGGTGLGLAIVKHTALSHGGRVTVWSHLGEGSTFTLCLPLHHGGAPEAASNEAEQHAPSGADTVVPGERDGESRELESGPGEADSGPGELERAT